MSVVPMKKLTVLTHVADGPHILELLQGLGVVHMHSLNDSEPNHDNEAFADHQRLERLSRALENVSAAPISKQIDDATLQVVVDLVEGLLDERESLVRQRVEMQEAMLTMRPWGNFNPADVAYLREQGVPVTFAQVTREEWHLIRGEVDTYHITREEEGCLFIVFFGTRKLPFTALKLPDKGLNQLARKVKRLEADIEFLNQEMGRYRHFAPLLRARMAGLQDQAELLQAIQGGLQNGPLSCFQGFFPARIQQATARLLDAHRVAYVVEDPTPEDQVPVLLHNNRFFSGFEAILKAFSGVDYWEKDVTWMVGLLFIVFGSLCLLDAGYGLLLLMTGLILRFKGMTAMGRVFLWTGTATIPLGLINGQIFGLIFGRDILLNTSPPLPLAEDPMACFVFSLMVGLLGMMLSYGVAVWQRGPRDHATGNLMLLAALVCVVIASLGVPEAVAPLHVLAGVLGLGGLVAWLRYPQPIFESHLGNILWTLYAGITGIMQDILSHMRLFGIALSGSILAMVVNRIGGMLPVPVTAAFAVVGHSFVYVLALLSLYIHTNRLIFLEVGGKCISGGHYFYEPLKRG